MMPTVASRVCNDVLEDAICVNVSEFGIWCVLVKVVNYSYEFAVEDSVR